MQLNEKLRNDIAEGRIQVISHFRHLFSLFWIKRLNFMNSLCYQPEKLCSLSGDELASAEILKSRHETQKKLDQRKFLPSMQQEMQDMKYMKTHKGIVELRDENER